ncbi:MAG: LPS translocon maturation chaperone LptM [Aquabacterium sp.]
MNQTTPILGTRARIVMTAAQRTGRRLGVCALLITATSALLGCGLKGPLYLPAPATTAATGASAPTPAKP